MSFDIKSTIVYAFFFSNTFTTRHIIEVALIDFDGALWGCLVRVVETFGEIIRYVVGFYSPFVIKPSASFLFRPTHGSLLYRRPSYDMTPRVVRASGLDRAVEIPNCLGGTDLVSADKALDARVRSDSNPTLAGKRSRTRPAGTSPVQHRVWPRLLSHHGGMDPSQDVTAFIPTHISTHVTAT